MLAGMTLTNWLFLFVSLFYIPPLSRADNSGLRLQTLLQPTGAAVSLLPLLCGLERKACLDKGKAGAVSFHSFTRKKAAKFGVLQRFGV